MWKSLQYTGAALQCISYISVIVQQRWCHLHDCCSVSYTICIATNIDAVAIHANDIQVAMVMDYAPL